MLNVSSGEKNRANIKHETTVASLIYYIGTQWYTFYTILLVS